MKTNDLFQTPFPRTVAELTALNATREIPFLKAHCNRRYIPTPGPNPTVAEIIPIIQQHLDRHRASRPKCSEHSDLYTDWQLTHDDLAEFLIELRTLAPKTPNMVGPAVPSGPRRVHRTSQHTFRIERAKNEPPTLLNLRPFPQFRAGRVKNPRHFQQSTATPQNPRPFPQNTRANFSPISNRQSSIVNQAPPIDAQSPAKPPRITPLLSKLSPETIQTLIALCEELPNYKEVSRHAREKLSLKISPASLCRLYTGHKIAEDTDAREEYLAAAAPGQTIPELTEAQLHLRLLELTSRPTLDASELRAICQSLTRMQAVKLSERRVQVAEKREARMQQAQVQRETAPVQKIVDQKDLVVFVKRMLGKEIPMASDEDENFEDAQVVENPPQKQPPPSVNEP